MIKTLFLSVVLAGALTANAQDKMTQLENRISELEAAQSLNIFKFSGALETMYDAIDAKQSTPTTSAAFKDHTDYLRLKVMLNMDAAVSPKLNFYSRLINTQFFNKYDQRSNGSGVGPDYNTQMTEVRGYNDSAVYLEKAYADYKVTKSFVMSFGRLPTEDGPLYHITENRPRAGTYPNLMYNTPLDGLAMSYNQDAGGGQVSARVIYSPFTTYADASGKLGGNGILEKPLVGGIKSSTQTELTSVMVEYSNNMFALIYQGYQTGKFGVSGTDINLGAGAGSGKATFAILAHSLTAEADNIMSTGLTIGATYLTAEIKNTGDISVPTGGPALHMYGLGASKEGDKPNGSTALVSARYNVNNKMSLGAEYLNGSKNTFVYDTSSDYLTGFYATHGTASQFYVNYKFEPELTLRVGAMSQDYDYGTLGLSAQSKTNKQVNTVYSKLRLDF